MAKKDAGMDRMEKTRQRRQRNMVVALFLGFVIIMIIVFVVGDKPPTIQAI